MTELFWTRHSAKEFSAPYLDDYFGINYKEPYFRLDFAGEFLSRHFNLEMAQHAAELYAARSKNAKVQKRQPYGQPVTINGVEYPNVKTAAKVLGVSVHTIYAARSRPRYSKKLEKESAATITVGNLTFASIRDLAFAAKVSYPTLRKAVHEAQRVSCPKCRWSFSPFQRGHDHTD